MVPAVFVHPPQCSNNLLYPKEDRENEKLTYFCKQCRTSEPAQQNLVYRNELKKEAAYARWVIGSAKHKICSEWIKKDAIHTFVDDHTLPKTKNSDCPKCHGRGMLPAAVLGSANG